MPKDRDFKKILTVEDISYNDSFLSELLKLLPVHVFWKDADGVYLGCNKVFASGLGFSSPKDIVGKTDYDLPVKKELSDLYRQDDLEVIQSRKAKLNIEEEQTDIHGKQSFLLTNKVPLIDKNDKAIGILGIYSDITDLKKAKESAETASNAKSLFISNMSHDLRTPITGMVGMIQSLLSHANQAKEDIKAFTRDNMSSRVFLDFVNLVERNSNVLMDCTESLLLLVNDTLESIHLESGKITTHIEYINLNTLVTDNIKTYLPAARHKNIDFIAEIHSSTPIHVMGDKRILTKIVLNLLSNAIKFTMTGSITLAIQPKIKKTYLEGDNLILIISVKDTGIGIPQDKLELIFDKFERLTPSCEGNYDGYGLGLYSVKKYIEMLKGYIHVDSEIEKGSTFSVELPVIVACKTQCIEEKTSFRILDSDSSQETSKPNNPPRSKILIVEDNEIAAIAIKLILDNLNVGYDHANCGADAVEKISDNSYGLVLMDVGLPDFSGIEATRKIRSLSDSNKSGIPIVALTGHAEKDKECITSGMQDIIRKPADPKIIETLINKYFLENGHGDLEKEPS